MLPQWRIPFTYALAAVLAGLILPKIEVRYLPDWAAGISTAAAMAIYSAIATGMITLTGVVFSLAFVMVQFSATAYSPRLVLWMARDPLVWHAIGVFTATFLYAVAALAWVDRSDRGRVPFFSGWLTILMLLASVGVFVALVGSLQRLQIDRVLSFTGDFARKNIDALFPPLETKPAERTTFEYRKLPVTQSAVYHGAPRAIQALDVGRLVALAERSGGVMEVQSAVGTTLVESTPVVVIYGGNAAISENEICRAFRIGTDRTFEQDPKYAIQLLRDIAIRALSPALNDPTTAVQALDQIEDLLLRLARRRLEIGEVPDSSGRLRVVIPTPSWEDLLDVSISEIRHYGADSQQVMRRLNALLSDLIEHVPEQRRPALKAHQKRLKRAIDRSFEDLEDRIEATAEDREGLGAPRTLPQRSQPQTAGSNGT